MSNAQALSDQVAMAVGWIAMEAAEVEFAAAQLEAQLLGTHLALSVVLGQNWQATKQGIDAILAAEINDCEHDAQRADEPDCFRTIGKTLKRADELMTARGQVVHALWLGLDNDNPRAPVTIKRWGRRVESLWTIEDLQQLRADLRRVRIEINGHTRR